MKRVKKYDYGAWKTHTLKLVSQLMDELQDNREIVDAKVQEHYAVQADGSCVRAGERTYTIIIRDRRFK